jgi:hypothetical protein
MINFHKNRLKHMKGLTGTVLVDEPGKPRELPMTFLVLQGCENQ